MNTTKKTGLLFILTGLILIGYSLIIINYFENIDLGRRFQTKEFLESDLYQWLGLFWISIGLIYLVFYKIDRIQLVDKLSKRHYWLTLFFVIELISVPIQNKYYPTKNYRDTILMDVFNTFLAISFILFLIGKFGFIINLIKSTYAYFAIKKGWRN